MKVVAVGLAVAVLTFIVVKQAVRQSVGDAEIRRMTLAVVNSTDPSEAWRNRPNKAEFYQLADSTSRDYALAAAAVAFIATIGAEALWRRRSMKLRLHNDQ